MRKTISKADAALEFDHAIGGVGGSFACGDTATGIAFAVTKNRLTPDFNAAAELSQIVKKALGRG